MSRRRPNPDFALNEPRYQGAQILLARRNFGCGSSREHAPWALRDYGFRAIIAPSFADIFANNCVKNGVLTVVLRQSEIAQLLARDAAGLYRLKIDLEQSQVSWNGGFQAHFDIDSFSRSLLLEGLDEIGTTLKRDAEITKYEQERQAGL
jgi:3-isopropylmalate/(R)-2-methylmalate dehydratase small subunit